MTPQKDYAAVIEAARLLEREAPGTFRFQLVGNGAEKTELMRASRALVESGAVIFCDAGLDALDVIKSAHVGVLMTNAGVHAEGCSNAIMEYMASGLPVVCSDSGGSAELVRDGQDGYVIAPHDAATLARSVAKLRDDPELRRAMGASGRSRIEDDFGTERMVTEYLRVYEEVMGRRRRAGA